MHGIVFNQLFKYVREHHGEKNLRKILQDAGVGSKFFDSTKSHPDEELESIISSACSLLGAKRDDVLEAFGEYIAPGLLKVYKAFIKKEWDVMDLLENVETTIHRAVRLNNPNAEPPKLEITRVDSDNVKIIYSSKRNMLHLGIGIIKAIGKHYNARLTIQKIMTKDNKVLKIKRS